MKGPDLPGLRIAMALPACMGVGNPGNGIQRQAIAQADALSQLGHDVVPLDPWHWQKLSDLDVLHVFCGGYDVIGFIEPFMRDVGPLRVYAPIIDSNHPNWRYRLASWVDNLVPRHLSAPGIHRRLARSSDLVIVRSAHEQDRVVNSLGVPAQRVRVVLNGTAKPDAIPPAQAQQALRDEYDLPEKFVLSVSDYTAPRKNILRLVHACEQAGLPLVLAGNSRIESATSVQLDNIARHKREPGLRCLPFLSHDALRALMAASHVFCLPSKHEGTGLAALEAAALGVPVVITSRGGTRDYFGSLALYVDPDDVADIARALQATWTRPRTTALQTHVQTQLTWEASARSLVNHYQHALALKKTRAALTR